MVPTEPGKPVVVVVDDSRVIVKAWERFVKDATVITFTSATRFLEDLAGEKAMAASINIVVTDFYFDGEALDGVTVAAAVRRHSTAFVVLSSNTESSELANAAPFDAVIGKEPHTYADLCRALAAEKSRPVS